MKEQLRILKKHILTGTSHMIPFIVAGGILFSLAVMLNPEGGGNAGDRLAGRTGTDRFGRTDTFSSVLGGYMHIQSPTSPALRLDMIGAYLAREMGAWILGGMAAGR